MPCLRFGASCATADASRSASPTGCRAASPAPSGSWLERLLLSLGVHVHGRPPRFDDPELVRAILERHGFKRVSVAAEEFPLRFVDFDEWWRWGWSHAYRKILESLANPELDRYRIEAASHLERMSPIEARLEVLIGIGTKL